MRRFLVSTRGPSVTAATAAPPAARATPAPAVPSLLWKPVAPTYSRQRRRHSTQSPAAAPGSSETSSAAAASASRASSPRPRPASRSASSSPASTPRAVRAGTGTRSVSPALARKAVAAAALSGGARAVRTPFPGGICSLDGDGDVCVAAHMKPVGKKPAALRRKSGGAVGFFSRKRRGPPASSLFGNSRSAAAVGSQKASSQAAATAKKARRGRGWGRGGATGATPSSSSSSGPSGPSGPPAPQLVQATLDLGQRGAHGAMPCATCGMMYTRGAPVDEQAHAEYCASVRTQRVTVTHKRLAREKARGVDMFPCPPRPLRPAGVGAVAAAGGAGRRAPGRPAAAAVAPGSGAVIVEVSAATSKYAMGKVRALRRIMADCLGIVPDDDDDARRGAGGGGHAGAAGERAKAAAPAAAGGGSSGGRFLGHVPAEYVQPAGTRHYLYVQRDGTVRGCLAAQTIRRAAVARLVPVPGAGAGRRGEEGGGATATSGGSNSSSGSSSSGNTAADHNTAADSGEVVDEDLDMLVTHATETALADIGVSQVWVHEAHRRQGIATRLLDAARQRMIYGFTVPLSRVAFTQPTHDGLWFSRAYTGSGGGAGALLVYDDSDQ